MICTVKERNAVTFVFKTDFWILHQNEVLWSILKHSEVNVCSFLPLLILFLVLDKIPGVSMMLRLSKTWFGKCTHWNLQEQQQKKTWILITNINNFCSQMCNTDQSCVFFQLNCFFSFLLSPISMSAMSKPRFFQSLATLRRFTCQRWLTANLFLHPPFL